jgi:hypothetical protein
MPDDRAGEVIRDQERMAADRAVWEGLWEDAARRVLPRLADVTAGNWRTVAQRRDELMFDSTAPMALEVFAAAMESVCCPRSQKWHTFRVRDEALNDQPEVARYMDALADQVFAMRYRPAANFAGQMAEVFMEMGVFGPGCLLVDEVPGVGTRYEAIDVVEMYLAENAVGQIDKVHRKFKYTARQAVQAYGENCPDEIKTRAEREPEHEFEFIHCVKPNAEIKRGMRNYRGMPFASYHVSITGQQIVQEGGYRTMPYCVGRYQTTPREVYGRSPAINVLASIKMINEMAKTVIKGAQLSVSPPLLLPDADTIRAFQVRPDALNYGGVDEQGRALVQPLQLKGEFQVAFEVMQQVREAINRAFFVTVFQILIDNPQMTATEVLMRAQEKGILLSPVAGRIQAEILDPVIQRELDIITAANAAPQPPEILLESGGLEIQYETPLTRAQRAGDALALQRTFEGIAPLAQINPEVMARFNADEVLNMLADAHGLPPKTLRSPAEMEALAQQAALMQIAQAVPAGATAARDIAQAGKLSAETMQIAQGG